MGLLVTNVSRTG